MYLWKLENYRREPTLLYRTVRIMLYLKRRVKRNSTIIFLTSNNGLRLNNGKIFSFLHVIYFLLEYTDTPIGTRVINSRCYNLFTEMC